MSKDKLISLLAAAAKDIAINKQQGLSDKEAFLQTANNLSIVLYTMLSSVYNVDITGIDGEEIGQKVIDFITEELILLSSILTSKKLLYEKYFIKVTFLVSIFISSFNKLRW